MKNFFFATPHSNFVQFFSKSNQMIVGPSHTEITEFDSSAIELTMSCITINFILRVMLVKMLNNFFCELILTP